MTVRIGEILTRQGVLDADQVRRVLEIQRATGGAFGQIAEEHLGADPADIEAAWLTQYELATERVDPLAEPPEPDALHAVTRRQAWQFRVLPLSRRDRELTLCTTAAYLGRTLRFAANILGEPSVVVLTEPTLLGAALSRHYPIEGFDAEDLLSGARAVC